MLLLYSKLIYTLKYQSDDYPKNSLDTLYILMYIQGMENKSPRIQIGAPFAALVEELLKSTNTNNLSRDWNSTDMVRYSIAQLWVGSGKTLPKECVPLLPHFWEDLDV